uniref:Uncharacterized protein n=1 Tax=Lygus hesperus TaxID=30085 RepID=A0A146M720_LYGHE
MQRGTHSLAHFLGLDKQPHRTLLCKLHIMRLVSPNTGTVCTHELITHNTVKCRYTTRVNATLKLGWVGDEGVTYTRVIFARRSFAAHASASVDAVTFITVQVVVRSSDLS